MRWTRAALLASSLTVLLTAACGAGPSQRPGVAVEQPHGGPGPAVTGTSTAPPPPPQAQVPKTDLSWHDCAAPTFNLLGTGAPPPGVIFECADFSTPIDTGGTVLGTFRTGAVRVRTAQTPADAAPVVVTSGTDRSTTATLAGLVSGPEATILADHPLVGVDRRGLGSSQPIDCLFEDTRRDLADNGQFTPGGDRVDATAKLSQDATVACQDFLQPYQAAYDAPHAADDIEQLRKQWQVDRIDLLGTGNGTRVALSYAAKYGNDHLARLVLDSPETVGADQVTRTEQQVKGAEAALTGFARRCADLNCSLGADPRAAITDLVGRAGAGQLGTVSASALTTTITAFLGDPRADQTAHTAELADALSAAGRGDLGALQALMTRETAAVGSDGQFVSRCSDNQQAATPDRAKQLENDWGTKYPVFGRSAASGLMECSAWPVVQAPRQPDKFTLPVLVVGTAADPVTGGDGPASVTGVLGAAGARTSTLQWQGWGHPVLSHSSCAQQNITRYLKDAELPADGTVCPA